jgi:hypothetical protein
LTSVQKLAITTAGSVQKTAITTAGTVSLAQAAVNSQVVANQTSIASQLAAGGLGNKNRSTIAALFFPQGAGPAQAIQYGGAATTGGMWAGISSIVGSVFGGGVPTHP